MSSDDDLLQRDNDNIFTYANDNTTIYAKGPNVNNTNMTGLSFGNNVLTSTMRLPLNFKRQRYAGSHYDQRSMTYRREMSPMSLRGASNFGPCNFNHFTYRKNMGCRSMCRGGSPFSVRSIDSTATVSAVDIVFALKNRKFDSHDLRIIKEAYKHLIKLYRRKRIEKRRNLRLKRSRRKSGEGSSDQESDLSISSDDSRSIKRNIYNENAPQSHLSTNIRNNQIVKDCTENIKQNTLKNMFTNNRANYNTKEIFTNNRPNYSTKEIIQNTSVIKPDRNPSSTLQNMSIITQKERFKRGFLLPSQRFNKTVNGTLYENDKTKLINGTKINNLNSCSKMAGPESDNFSEEIFTRLSDDTSQAIRINRKRALNTEDDCSNRKRSTLDFQKQRLPNSDPVKITCNSQSSDFIFAKPKKPVKKSDTKNVFAHEKLLAKFRVPSIAEENDLHVVQTNNPIEKKNTENIENETHLDIQHGTSDISMRPSFIKRKLFTQKMDVTENKNVCCDSVTTNRPQNVYTEALKERNKARKLVTSQSCLSRDIAGEDHNVLDLLHKIVSSEQINTSKRGNKTDLSTNKYNNVHSEDKWDVTSAILNCSNQDVSDTYTDEEIFTITFNKESANKGSIKQKKVNDCPEPKLNNTKKRTTAKSTIINVKKCHKEAKVNISLRSQRNQTVKDKIFEKIYKPNLIAKANMEETTVGDHNKNNLNNKKYNTNEKKEKENIKEINKKQDSGRKPKVKKCTHCNDQKQSMNVVPTTKKENTIKKKNENLKHLIQKSNTKSICTPELKETKNRATHLDIENGTSHVSMRPSFIKRKLFTQKLDVTENKNVSRDSVATNSPQNVYTEALRERNKTRKLVTSQSCLSRDIAGEDNNVLDLIHKIVPLEQINTTKTANKTDLSINKSNNVYNVDKRDVTSAILNCNNQDVRDTYTDEEIFNITCNKESANKEKFKKVAVKPKPMAQCKVVVEKLNPKIVDILIMNYNNYKLPCSQQTNKGSIQQKIQLNNTKKRTIAKGTILNVRNCHKEVKVNISLRSQKDLSVKDKICEKIGKPNLITKANMELTAVGDKDKNKLNNKIHNINVKKEKENIKEISKKEDSGSKPKVKKFTNCNDQKQSIIVVPTNKKESTSDKLKKKNENVKQIIQRSNTKSICTPEPKETKKGANNNITKLGKNCNVKLQNTNMNERIQLKSKCKEKIFNQSPKPRQTINNAKATKLSNNSAKSKLMEDSVLKNSCLNILNTRTTRSSREKLAFDSSVKSSANISSLSNGSLRLRQRNFREYNIYQH